MDILAHALWANLAMEGIARKRKKPLTHRDRLATIMGSILPDLLAFLPYLLVSVVTGGGLIAYASARVGQEWGITWLTQGVALPTIPNIVYAVYGYTHSALLWLVVGLVIWLLVRRLSPMWVAWGTHIALDVFTHDAAHFPTRLLYPFSEWHINATAWSNPIVLGCTYVALLLCYLAVYTRRSSTT
jgi:hypothetical protein